MLVPLKDYRVAEIVYPPVIVALKTFWKYLGLQFHFEGESHIPRKGGAILAMNHIGYLDFALIGTAALPAGRLVRDFELIAIPAVFFRCVVVESRPVSAQHEPAFDRGQREQ